MKFPLRDTLTSSEVDSGLKVLLLDGFTSQAMVTLTGGIFLIDFALQLGASNLAIGILAAIPLLSQMLQLPATYLVEWYRVRRSIFIYAGTISRLFLLAMAIVPFLPRFQLQTLILALFFHASFSAIAACSWNSWMRDLVPKHRLGTIFSKRMSLIYGTDVLLSLAAGYYIYQWVQNSPTQALSGYSVLFLLGFIAGISGIYLFGRVPEPRMHSPATSPDLVRMLGHPFGDINFRNYVIFWGLWNFSMNLAAPFFVVYMLETLNLEMSFAIEMRVLSQLMGIAFLSLFGQQLDRYGNKAILNVSCTIFTICTLAWTFTTLPDKHGWTIPMLVAIHVLIGIATPGITLAGWNIGIKLAPSGQATSYLAASAFVSSMAACIAPILGGQFADFFAYRQLALKLQWTSPGESLVMRTLDLQHWDFFFALAFAIGLYAIHTLKFVRENENGDLPPNKVVPEMMAEVFRPLRNFSTIGGLRGMTQFSFTILRFLKKR